MPPKNISKYHHAEVPLSQAGLDNIASAFSSKEGVMVNIQPSNKINTKLLLTESQMKRLQNAVDKNRKLKLNLSYSQLKTMQGAEMRSG